jgi:hypothetical protein
MLGDGKGEINEILTRKWATSARVLSQGALLGPGRNDLLFKQIRVIDVLTAALSRTRRFTVTSNTEEQSKTEASASARAPEVPTKANVAPRKPRVAPPKPKSGKEATPAKRAAKSPRKATSAKAEGVREGSKTAKVLDLLKRPGGATMKELLKATGWLPHSVRGFISGTIGKKMRLNVTSAKGEGGDRSYSVRG